MTKDPLSQKNALLRDASECQRLNGMLPDTRADEDVWTSILESEGQKAADVKATSSAAKQGTGIKFDKNPARTAKELIRRRKDGTAMIDGLELKQVLARAKPLPTRGTPGMESKLAKARLMQLYARPVWHMKVVEAFNAAAKDHAIRTGKVTMVPSEMKVSLWVHLKKVLDESNKDFPNRWDRLPEKKVTVHGRPTAV